MTLPTPKSDRLERVLVHWRNLKGDRDIPSRSSFSPDEVAPQDLPFLALLTVRDGGADLTYRLVGTGIVDVVGHEFTGVRIADYIDMHEVPEMLEAYVDAARNRRVTLYEGTLKRLDKEHVRYERLALPLAGPDGAVCQILAAFEFATRPSEQS